MLVIKTYEKRIRQLEEALQHLLEVQVTPSTVHHEEWDDALTEARKVLRDKI